MASYVLTVNERTANGKLFMSIVKAFEQFIDCVSVTPQKKEQPYNPEFVAKILQSDKSKGVKIKREDLWK